MIGAECKACRGPILSRRSDAVYCSKRCALRGQSRICSEPGCPRPHRAKGMCNAHYKAAGRAAQRWKPAAWSARRRDNYHTRKARQRGAKVVEKFTHQEIFERDGWLCGICSEPVAPDLAYPDPLSASLDHVVPLSRGGSHTRGNVRCSHLRCNLQRGAGCPVVEGEV